MHNECSPVKTAACGSRNGRRGHPGVGCPPVREHPITPTRCWSGIRSSSTRSLLRTRQTPRVNGSERSFTPRSSTRTTGSSVATRRYSSTAARPRGASRRAAVIAAAHTALVGLFPSRQAALNASYAASLAALSDDGGTAANRDERGIAWGIEVANAVLAWRASDGFTATYPAFTGGTTAGQWRPTPPAFGPMSAQGLAFTSPFVLDTNAQFQPEPPRTLNSTTYTEDFNTVKALGRRTESTRTARSDGAGAVLGGQRQCSLESGGEPDSARQQLVHVRQQSAARCSEHRNGRHRIHHLERKAILWRHSGRSDLAASDGDCAGGHGRKW